MKNKMNFLEDYSTKKQITYFYLFIVLFFIISALFLNKYPNEKVPSCLIKDKWMKPFL